MLDIKKALPVFSYIFHPIFISLYGVLFYFLTTPNLEFIPVNKIYLTLIQVTILTILLPLSLFFLLISIGVIASFTEASLKERKVPILTQALLIFALLKFSVSVNELPELYYFFLGGFISTVLVFISVLLRFKASLHMIGISTLTCFIYILCYAYNLPFINTLAVTILCTGLVAASRLQMKSHTQIELITGLLIGIIPQILLWHFWL